MASAPKPMSTDAKKPKKPSFAKIVAAGNKPPNAQRTSNINTSSNDIHDISSAPLHSPANASPADAAAPLPVALQQVKLVQLAPKDNGEEVGLAENGAQVRVQMSESVPKRIEEPGLGGLLVPSSEDVGTQLSSSSGSNKPPSLDGKSVASGTTFALDEKDSLRPDDSASVKAVEEDDVFSSGSVLPGSRLGSDEGVRAFRDQLREISSMEPQRQGPPPQIYGTTPKGVLYVPPPGPGVGAVPTTARVEPIMSPNVDVLPDQKLLDALDNPRDRVWVLKLEQDVIDFVKDPKESSLTLPQCHSFYRLLAHKMADYYMLGHLLEDTSAAVRLYKTPNCRIPPPLTGVTAPFTAASTPPPSAPQMKILRRGAERGAAVAYGSGIPSKSGSENGDSGEDDRKVKAPVTREEREARYEAARLRIMGSAKPNEMPEEAKEMHESRSSSANGRRNKKKQRAESDDDFEARSAYSNYYTASFGSEGVAPASYAYPEYNQATTQYSSAYGQQRQTDGTPQQLGHGAGYPAWSQQTYHSVDPTQAWAQGQSAVYNLSADFHRAMTFQNPIPGQNASASFNAVYGPNYYGSPQDWPQQQYQVPGQVNQAVYGYSQPLTPLGAAQALPDQPYAYGQLPSQAFPGRPASKNEHPLPGSYKGKTFNPQTQAFIPGQAEGPSFSPQAAPAATSPITFGTGYSAPPQIQRQNSVQSQNSGFASPHHNSSHMAQNRVPGQPMTHPLPQGPVYPRQSSPNMPLPSKPGTTPQQMPATLHMPHSQSLLAKWGTPSSLPAKPPPPSAEHPDASKAASVQRQPFPSAAPVARPPGAFPTFGAMPQSGSAQIVNGSGGGQPSRRG